MTPELSLNVTARKNGSAAILVAADIDRLANDTVADAQQHDSLLRQAAVIALRNGARLLSIRHHLDKKAVTAFKKLCEGRGASRRTLESHQAITEEVFEEMGWMKAGKVCEPDHLAMVHSASLDLFTDPSSASREDAIGLVLRQLGGRSIRDILRSLNTDPTLHIDRTFGGSQSPGPDHSDSARRDRQLAAARAMAEEIRTYLLTDGCWHIDAAKGRRLTPDEAAEQGMAFTLGLLPIERPQDDDSAITADDLIALFGQAIDTLKHHKACRAAKLRRAGK